MANAIATFLKDAFTTPSFASAIVGTIVGGAISMAGQWITIRETRKHRADDRRLNQVARCSSLLFKLLQISTNIFRGTELLEAHFKHAEEANFDLDMPVFFGKEIANPGHEIEFLADEISVMLQLGEKEVFNSIVSLDNCNNTYLSLILIYNERRRNLISMMKTEVFDFSKGMASGNFTREETIRLMPYIFECSNLIQQILSFKAEVQRVQRGAVSLTEMMHRRLGTKIDLTWESPATEAAGPKS